ncbi:arginase [Paraeggerthella hongkongensis]|uniref:Arginase n=1 Tax=Paraeggerthella hongkongensis TaxID=230658 RepID=A0A3N0BC05_9ACTN|nr:arginase [Paraeggerthella hongkongensis]
MRLLSKPKPDSYTEAHSVDAAGGWRERNVAYLGRPHGRAKR